ncbi:MAG TPA: hypothetical protein VKX25_01005 [Bryobacteraceae bacterium]|nr:hypothetical protein [Bryobacteraceae bacterium]
MISRALGVLILACAGSGLATAQWNELTVGGKTIDVHGFFSQGFAVSDQNNFLTMPTSSGSFAFTDFGLNASTQLTNNFRIGAQIYDRNIGKLGEWRPEIDWAYGDYKFADWLGVRAGKVKTVMGLYNDTQDLDFLHTFALLPQSVYPTDLRGQNIAHTGADVYGTFGTEGHGEIAYTGYVGELPLDRFGGYVYGAESAGVNLKNGGALQSGGDLRWNNLLPGFTAGVSFLNQAYNANGVVNLEQVLGVPGSAPYSMKSIGDHRTQFYTEYRKGPLLLQGEYFRRTWSIDTIGLEKFSSDERGWYGAGTYRISPRLEFGAYHSRYYPSWKETDFSQPSNHIYDQAITANINLTSFWYVKLEGHFMDGYGVGYSFRGFYPQDNPQGLKSRTDLFVIRTGFNF